MAVRAPKATFIADILEEHYEELSFLWGQRKTALRSPVYSYERFLGLEERIEARVQGLSVQREAMVPFVAPGLNSEDALDAFAAAYAFLRLGSDAAVGLVREAFFTAEGDKASGIAEALAHGPSDMLRSDVDRLAASPDERRSAHAAWVLACRGKAIEPDRVSAYVKSSEAGVKKLGWRLAAQSGVVLGPSAYSAAMRDGDADVMREAITAAAWLRQPGVLQVCRYLAADPKPEHADALLLLGILGTPEDLPLIRAVARTSALGKVRFQVLGAYGCPATVEYLIEQMQADDPEAAAAAGAAFTKITGEDVASERRVPVRPRDGRDPDEFESEFLKDVRLPDPDKAQAHWNKVQQKYAMAPRVCRGIGLGPALAAAILAQFDMESRWETLLRMVFQGAWKGKPFDLERFRSRKCGDQY